MPAISAGILLYRWRTGVEGARFIDSRDAGAPGPETGRPTSSGVADAGTGRLLEVLLVHPGGPYWRTKGAGSWSIPKGEAEPGELGSPPPPAESWQRPREAKPRLTAANADLLAVAKREFREETGFEPDGLAAVDAPRYTPLGGIKQRHHKIVYVWALEGDCDAEAVQSEEFTMEWPPHSGRMASFPEVDTAAWFTVPAAHEAINAGQRRFLDELAVLAAQDLPDGTRKR